MVEFEFPEDQLNDNGSFRNEFAAKRTGEFKRLLELLEPAFRTHPDHRRVVVTNECSIPFELLGEARKFSLETRTHLIAGLGYVPSNVVRRLIRSGEVEAGDESLLRGTETSVFNLAASICPDDVTYLVPKIEKSAYDSSLMAVPRMKVPPVFLDHCGALGVFTIWTCLDLLQPLKRLVDVQGKIDVLIALMANRAVDLHLEAGRFFRWPGYCYTVTCNNISIGQFDPTSGRWTRHGSVWSPTSGVWWPGRTPIDVLWTPIPDRDGPKFSVGFGTIDVERRRRAIKRKDPDFYRIPHGFLENYERLDETDHDYRRQGKY